MNQFSMCNMIEELSNQVDLENDVRWMSSSNEDDFKKIIR